MPTPAEIVRDAIAKMPKAEVIHPAHPGVGPLDSVPARVEQRTEPTNLITPRSTITNMNDEIRVKHAKWETTDGLPPRYVGGNLQPVNAKL